MVGIAILLINIGYAIASSFTWSISPLNADVHPGFLYGLGYTPVIIITFLFNFCGYCEPNEDKALILLRGDSLGPKKYRFKRKAPLWWTTGRLILFSRDKHGGDEEKPIREDSDRYVELGLVGRSSDQYVKDGTGDGTLATVNIDVDIPTPSTSDRSPFSDGAADSTSDYIEQTVGGLRSGPEYEGNDGARRRESDVSTAADESRQSERTVHE